MYSSMRPQERQEEVLWLGIFQGTGLRLGLQSYRMGCASPLAEAGSLTWPQRGSAQAPSRSAGSPPKPPSGHRDGVGGLESNSQLLNHSSQGKIKRSRKDGQTFDSRAKRDLLNVSVADVRGKSMASRHRDQSHDKGGRKGGRQGKHGTGGRKAKTR